MLDQARNEILEDPKFRKLNKSMVNKAAKLVNYQKNLSNQVALSIAKVERARD